jgi:hypothetical protein
MVLLMVLPMPFFAGSINRYHQLGEQTLGAHIAYMNKISRLYKNLREIIPPNVPAMTSENYQSCEKFGDNMFCWIDHGVSYYVDRPLVCSTDVNEIEANAQGCAAYVIVVDDPNKLRLAEQLASKYKVGWQDEGYIFFLLTATN